MLERCLAVNILGVPIAVKLLTGKLLSGVIPDDPITRLVAQWKRERPDLDPYPMATIGRLLRAARIADRAIEHELSRHGLQLGWFDVLSALRRAGAPYELTPGRLADSVMLSTGGMTKRLDRMESADLVTRSPDPSDRRGLLVGLTDKGRTTIDTAVEAHLNNEERLLRDLTKSERTQLERLLSKVNGDGGSRRGAPEAPAAHPRLRRHRRQLRGADYELRRRR